jgi:MFS family permease
MGNLLNFLVGIGMFGGLSSVPLYLQIVKGLNPTEAGMMLLPMTAGIMVSTGVVGKLISKTGRLKVFPIVGAAFMATALFLFSLIGVDTSLVQVGLTAVVMGGGLGMLMQTLTLVVQTGATPRDMGVATASVNLFRQTGGTVGAAAFLSVLFSTVGGRIADSTRAAFATPEFAAALRDPEVLANPVNRRFAEALQSGGAAGIDINDTSFLYGLDPRLARPVLEGFASSMDTVFFVGGCVVLVAFALTWFLRDIRLD